MTSPTTPLADVPAEDAPAPGAPLSSRPPSHSGGGNRLSSSGVLGLFRRDLGVDRFSGVYVIIVMIIGFSIWEPQTFQTWNNAKVILSSEAITGIITMAAVIALVAGVYDLSIAANMSHAISVLGKLMASAHLNAALAIAITLLLGGLVGCVNATIVTKFGIDPVIGTLAMSSVLAAVSYWVANGQTTLYGISKSFTDIGTHKPLGIPIVVYFLGVVALVLWYVLEHTPVGRYLYAAGANPKAARLSGVNVVRLQWGALITSGMLAALAGVILTMQLRSAAFGAGDSYLLPAYAAAFLGATQIKPGRFNVGGTLVALYLLAIGVKGLQLRYPSLPWIADLFQGLALIIAVALGVVARRKRAQSS